MSARRTPKRTRAVPWLGLGFLLILSLSSCAGDGSELDATGSPLDAPEIQSDRTTIELSLVEGTSDTSSFVVTNVGGFPLEIESVTATEDFLVPISASPISLEKDAVREISFLVEAGSSDQSPSLGTVHVSSNADLSPLLSVSVSLEITAAPAPEISITPDTLRSMIAEGQVDTVSFELLNSGTADLLVSRITSDLLEVTPLQQTGTILPNAAMVVRVRIDAAGLNAGTLDGALLIESNDEDESTIQLPIRVTIEPSGPFPATLTAIQENVFDASCSLAGCHGELFPPLNLRLAPGESWNSLYEMPSVFVPKMFLVKPFDSGNSFLISKLVELDKRRIGERMPIADQPYLTEDEIDVIRRWIDEGALDN